MNDGKIREAGAPEEGDGSGSANAPASERQDSTHSPGPTWKGWAISIIAAVILSVTATLLLGGWSSFRPLPASGLSTPEGCGGPCCPDGSQPAGEGKQGAPSR